MLSEATVYRAWHDPPIDDQKVVLAEIFVDYVFLYVESIDSEHFVYVW